MTVYLSLYTKLWLILTFLKYQSSRIKSVLILNMWIFSFSLEVSGVKRISKRSKWKRKKDKNQIGRMMVQDKKESAIENAVGLGLIRWSHVREDLTCHSRFLVGTC